MENYDITRNVVDFSNLQAIGCDEANQILYVEFNTNALYRCFDVPMAVFADLLSAGLKGSYLIEMLGK